MPQEDHRRSEVNHAEEVVGVPFPPRDDAAEVVKPGEEPLDLPASTATTERPAILGAPTAMSIVRRNQLDVVLGGQMLIEAVAVVPPIADQSRGELVEEARGERGVDERDFMRRSAGHVHGDRKTMAVADRHDFAALTASSRAN